MGEQLLTAFNALPAVERMEVLDFVMYLSNRSRAVVGYVPENSHQVSADELVGALEAATVDMPITWTRDEINARS